MMASAAMRGKGRLSCRGHSSGRSSRQADAVLEAFYLGIPRGVMVKFLDSSDVSPVSARVQLIVAGERTKINCAESYFLNRQRGNLKY
jgi:hypothetical protein